jgi:hypothetical protein
MMEIVNTTELSVSFYETTWHIIPKDHHLHTCCSENLKSHVELIDIPDDFERNVL